MNINYEIAARLEKTIRDLGANPSAVAKSAGMGHTGVRDIITRKTKSPTYATLHKIANVLEISVQEMLFGDIASADRSNFPAIPRYDARLSAGQGAMNSEHAEILDYIPFTDEFLGKKLGRSTVDGLICCYAHGESMSPTIEDGDLLVIDTKLPYRGAGMYALNYGDESFVKRVEKVDFGYTLVSDNTAYPPKAIQGDEVNQLHIIGKVVWTGGVVG